MNEMVPFTSLGGILMTMNLVQNTGGGIARALIDNPKLLLADEPTGNLNSKQGEEIMELFSKINKENKVTIIQVTHSEKNAAYGSRMIHLLDGRTEH